MSPSCRILRWRRCKEGNDEYSDSAGSSPTSRRTQLRTPIDAAGGRVGSAEPATGGLPFGDDGRILGATRRGAVLTEEHVAIPDDVVARIEGKSSLGRLGLIVHATAGFVDPGFEGTLTLAEARPFLPAA